MTFKMVPYSASSRKQYLSMKKLLSVSLASVLTLFSSIGYGQVAQVAKTSGLTTASTRTKLFPLSELKEGMKGTARTVFRGSEPEEFNVEILGILPGGI